MNSPAPPTNAAVAGIRRYAAIEAGGTKFNVAIGGSDGEVHSQAQFVTLSPEETIGEVIAWLDGQVEKGGPFSAIGVATFGPIDTEPASQTWGQLGQTPKLLWQGVDLITPFRSYGVPLALDTDVNSAALAEWRWGAGRGLARICYMTVGTGIGGGAVLDGKMLSGHNHPEMGHMFVRRHDEDRFAGACPSHGDCLEGLASGTSIQKRWGSSLSKLDSGHPGHRIIAHYLAQACINIVATLAPEKIMLGGGVIGTAGLIERVQDDFGRLANGYFEGFEASDILRAKLFPVSGLVGALAMAEMALSQDRG